MAGLLASGENKRVALDHRSLGETILTPFRTVKGESFSGKDGEATT
jgi:hypothetical protein